MSDDDMTNDADNSIDNGDSDRMTDALQNSQPTEKREVDTTYDVRSEAEEALRMFNQAQEDRLSTNREGKHIEGEDVIVRVEIQGGGTPLRVSLVDEIVIGRRDPTTKISPDLDLTPYGGYQMGISRRHAIVQLKAQNPVLTDLGSRNGTFVNGKKLAAHQPLPLQDGDEVRLGKIVIKLYFQEKE